MARIRSVHPGLFKDENFMDLVEQSPLGCVFLVGLWGQADDKGAFQWKPRTLKAEIFPGGSCDVSVMLEALVALNFIKQYEVAGSHYGAIRNFGKYQRPKKPNNIYPMPLEFRIYAATSEESTELEDDDGGGGTEPPQSKTHISTELDAPEVQASSVPIENLWGSGTEISPQMEDGGGREEGKKERKSSLRSPRASPSENPDFEAFWKAYPRKTGKGAARASFAKAVKKTSVPVILQAIANQQFDHRERFIPYPTTWLNQERWLDEQAQGDPVLRAVGLFEADNSEDIPDFLRLN